MKSTLASIERIPPLIPAKSQKEVNIISKYFKNKQPEMQTPGNNKTYAQASKLSTSTSYYKSKTLEWVNEKNLVLG